MTVAQAAPAGPHPGEVVYKARCAVCHDNSEATKAPSAATMARLTQGHITNALMTGIMIPQAVGLSSKDVSDVSNYLAKGGEQDDSWTTAMRCPASRATPKLDATPTVATFGFDLNNTRTLNPAKVGLAGKDLSTLDVAWTRAAGANFYQTGAYRVTPPHQTTSVELVYDQGQLNLGAQLTGFAADDYYQLEAVAFAPNYLARGLGGSMVNVSTQRSTYVDVIPANAGLRLEGTVTHITYAGQTYGSAWMSAFDGLTELTNADVQINGDPLVFETQWNMFGIESAQVTPGAAAALLITGNNKPTVSAAVVLPGDFTVDPVPATHPSGTALTLSWTASAGATSTRVWVSDMQGQTLFYENVLGTSVTIPALGVTGDVNLSVGAVLENPAERHLLGSVQKTFALTLQ